MEGANEGGAGLGQWWKTGKTRQRRERPRPKWRRKPQYGGQPGAIAFGCRTAGAIYLGLSANENYSGLRRCCYPTCRSEVRSNLIGLYLDCLTQS